MADISHACDPSALRVTPLKRALVAPDKFRGTASASDVAQSMSAVLVSAGYQVEIFPMSDGGEGLLEVFDGSLRSVLVTSATGKRISASYKMHYDTAIIEMATVAGLTLVGGASINDPMTATTRGVGELIKAAIFAGAKRVIVGCGGSATTDGGLGAIEALEPVVRLKGTELVVACDVETLFCDAARDFAPQKGATPAQVALLSLRMEALERQYKSRFGVDVSSLKGGGAAGGLAGGLAAIGGRLVAGFEVVAEANGIYEALEGASLIVTGEGYLDAQSYRGKVVGHVTSIASDHSIPFLVIVGDYDQEVLAHRKDRSRVFSLVAQVGEKVALDSTLESVKVVLKSALISNGLWSV